MNIQIVRDPRCCHNTC